MLDIKRIREVPDKVKEELRKRNNPDTDKWIDELLKLDEQWRTLRGETDELRSRRNKVSMQINQARKEKKDVEDLLAEAKSLPAHISNNEAKAKESYDRMAYLLHRIPNILHESVPMGRDASENKVIKEFGKKPKFSFEPISHVDLMTLGDLGDFDRAAKISGSRWYFLKGKLARLQFALMQYAVDFIVKKGHTMVIPPNMMRREAYECVVNLDEFEDAIYKIESEDLLAIATSEHPLTAQFMGENIEASSLPIKLFGYSPCYRKEAGAHGRDQKGIFRVHQFNKVEQIMLCRPEESWKLHDEMTQNAVEFWESLGLHFRLVTLCSGETGGVMAKTNDIEVWMPVQNAFREVGSISNASDYQSRRLNIKYVDGPERELVHTLNGTVTTDTRPLVAIMENNQDKDGNIKIPKVLQKYCGFEKIEVKK